MKEQPLPSIRSYNRRSHLPQPKAPLPPGSSIEKIATILLRQTKKQEREEKYAPVKEVLGLLGRGAIIAAAILAPKSVSNLAPLLRESPDYNAWKRYNISYLQRTLRNLEKLKQVEIVKENGQEVISLTQAGKRRMLRFSLDSLRIDKPKHWDRRWRLVLYDIPKDKNHTRDIFRDALRALGFYPIQESVYLYPYPCFDQIEFLRQYYGAGSRVQYMLVEHIENDAVYKTYFGFS